jgi:hypothetical protein
VPRAFRGLGRGTTRETCAGVLELIEDADDDLRSAARGYALLATELTRCDALAASARSRIAKARSRLPVADRKQLDRLDREALRARASVGPSESPRRRGRVLRAAIVAISFSVIGLAAATLVGVVSGLGGLPSLGVLHAFLPLNPFEIFWRSFLEGWGSC